MEVKESNEVEALYTKLTSMKKEIDSGNENELSLSETRLLILIRLKRYSIAIEEGYRILGKQGPLPFVYKCILVALCRTGKADECRQVLGRWKQSAPKDSVRKDVKHKIQAFYTAVISSGGDPSNSLIYLEKSLGLSEEWVFRNCDDSVEKWRFRTPPRQLTGRYTLCHTPVGCFYGDDCPYAHSSDELEEWMQRMDSIGHDFYDMNLSSTKVLDPIGSNKYRGGFSSTRGPRLMNGQSNGTFHLQNGPFTTTQTFQFSNGRTVTANCYTNENHFGQSYVHPPNLPYLNELIAKYNTCSNSPAAFVQDMDDVKFKPFTPLSLKSSKGQHVWSFALASREALRTVSLLNDIDRRHFHISGGTFYYGSRPLNLKDLHAVNRNSGLQVLNTFIPSEIFKDFGGWPQWFYYKIELTFRSELPGQYRQHIIFDFKKDPKLVKEVCIDVGEYEESDSASGSTTPDTNVQVVVVDSNSGFPIENGDWISPVRSKEGKAVHINKQSYVQEMTKILGQEISCRQSELKKQDKFQDLVPTNVTVVDGEQKIGNQLFCTIEFGNSLNEDNPVGKLIQQSCHQILLTSSDYPSRSYMCSITEKLSTSVIIALGKAIVQDLALKVDRPYNFRVELKLDVQYFDKMKRALNRIGDVELDFLFPDFANEVIFQRNLFNMFLETSWAFTLNQRQMDAYTAITNSTVGLTHVPPVILIGPFGTGKTYTLSQSVRKLLQSQPNCRILICTHSNSAADIYVTSMDEWNLDHQMDHRPLRVYFHERRVQTVSNIVKKYCTFETSGKFRYPTKEEISDHRVIITTLSISPELIRIGLGKSFFTHIIIDEAAQVLETEAIEPLLLANADSRIILAGDHMQLAPELFSTHGGASINILERMSALYPHGHSCKITLNENYRSHEKILKFAGDNFYSDSLRCSTIQPTHPHLYPLTFFSVRGQEASGSSSYFNSAEIQELGARLEFLISTWPPQWGDVEDPSSIAILTPYADQVQRLRAHLRLRNLAHISVERVQNVQGKQFRVVFLSTVRTIISTNDSDLDFGFLSNKKLFNTALTRAQSLVAVVGDPISLCSTGKCRNIWLAFIQEAMLNQALHGIHYDYLKSNLLDIERHGGDVKIKPVVPEYASHNFLSNQQITTPLAPLTQPTSTYNSFYSNFGPSPMTSPNINKIEPQPALGVFPIVSSTSNFSADNLQGNFNQMSLSGGSGAFGQNFEHLTSQNLMGLNAFSAGSPNPFYQEPSQPANNFNNNLSRPYGYPVVPPPIQRNIPIQNGHAITNGGTSELGIRAQAQLSHPPGFTERPGVIGMHTFDQLVKSTIALTSTSTSTSSTKEMNIKPNIVKIPNPKSLAPGASITCVSPPVSNTIVIENGKDSRSNVGTKISSPTFAFEDDFPSLTTQPPKKPPTEWIEVKPKKPKPQVNSTSNGKPKDPLEKTVTEKIETLVSMGFEKKRVIKALQLTDKDLEKSMELLLAGKEKTGVKDKN